MKAHLTPAPHAVGVVIESILSVNSVVDNLCRALRQVAVA